MKNRLFVFGDSWANNYFSVKNDLVKCKPFLGLNEVEQFAKYYNYSGHWIDYISNYYDVYSYGYPAATNEQIIFQLGNLPEYRDGDRIIIIFTTPQRINWIIDKRKYSFLPNGTQLKKIYGNDTKILNFIENQYIERSNWWFDNDIKKDEVLFINKIPVIYQKWNPLMITWTSDLSDIVTEVSLIEFNDNFTNIKEETDGMLEDYHLGVFGNYELFKYISNKFGLDTSSISITLKKWKADFI